VRLRAAGIVFGIAIARFDQHWKDIIGAVRLQNATAGTELRPAAKAGPAKQD
jgi:hypothetical protein